MVGSPELSEISPLTSPITIRKRKKAPTTPSGDNLFHEPIYISDSDSDSDSNRVNTSKLSSSKRKRKENTGIRTSSHGSSQPIHVDSCQFATTTNVKEEVPFNHGTSSQIVGRPKDMVVFNHREIARINTTIADCYESNDDRDVDANCLAQLMAFLTAQADVRKKQLELSKINPFPVNHPFFPVAQPQRGHITQDLIADELSKVFNNPIRNQFILQGLQNFLKGKDTLIVVRSPSKPGLHHLMAGVSRLDGSSGIALIVSPFVEPHDAEIASLKENSLTIDIWPRSRLTPRGNLNPDVLYITCSALGGCEGLLRELFSQKLISKVLLDSLDRRHDTDFYRAIATLRHAYLNIPIMVVTSNRRPPDKIADHFRLRDWSSYSQSPDPESLRLCVSRRTTTIVQDIVRFIHSGHRGEHGLVFCQHRTIGDLVLMQLGNGARYIHTNSNRKGMEQVLLDWHSGKFKVLVLMNDLGLSAVYRPDIRFVIHGEPPADLETYYHHACLAGGDGKPADAILYYSCSDVKDHSSGSSIAEKHRELFPLRSYCRNESRCRRIGLLEAVGEVYTKKCNFCDACHQGHEFVERNLTKEARRATELIQELNSKDKALRYCQEVFAGHCTAQVRNNGDHESVHFGAGSHLPFDCIEQLFEELYLMDIWKQSQHAEDWDNLIVKAGPAVSRIQDKSFQLFMKVRDDPQLSRRTLTSTLPLYRDDSDPAESSFREEVVILNNLEPVDDEGDCSMEVFSQMKALRLQLQNELGLAQAAEILDDQTLEYLSIARPLDYREFKRIVKECSSLSVPGEQDKYAEEKWNRFGQRFLNVCIVARPPHASE